MSTFFLGSHRPGWLALTDVPLFVSRRVLAGRRTLPRALGPWALDSGGFSELSLFGGWVTTAQVYADEARRYTQDIGRLLWCASRDLMCEPAMLAKTGRTVLDHQAMTVANYLDLRDRAPDLPWTPVLQGWAMDDYHRHADDYDRAGVDLAALPIVGLGSVCRRQHTAEVEGLIRRLSRQGLRLHGFGFKVLGLARIGSVLASSDSMAWSFRARRAGPCVCRSTEHKNGANCLVFALAWRDRVLAALAVGDARSFQPRLFDMEAAS